MNTEERLAHLEQAVLALIELCELPMLEDLPLPPEALRAAWQLMEFRKRLDGGKGKAA